MLKTALEHKQAMAHNCQRQRRKITILCDEYCHLKTKTRSGDTSEAIQLRDPRRLPEGKNKRAAS